MRITAAALLITATRSTSRGCTRIVSIVPMVTSWCPFTRRRVFNSSTTRHSHSGLKYGFVATCIRQYSAAWSGVSQTRMDSGTGQSRRATTLNSFGLKLFMGGLALRKRPAQNEVRRFLRLRRRIDDERPVVFELLQPTFKVSSRVINRPVNDVGIPAQKRAAEFGDQFLFAVRIGTVTVPFGDAGALQPFLMASGVNQFVKKRGKIAYLTLEPFSLRHSDTIIGRGIECLRHAVLHDGRLRHTSHNLRRFGDGHRNFFRCVFQAFALRGIEDVIQTEQRGILRLGGFLVLNFHPFPEDDGTRLLALLHVAAKLDGLAECEPMRRFVAHGHEQEYIDAAILLFAYEIPGQASIDLPRLVPGNSALL